MIFILLSIALLVLFFSWRAYSNRETPKAEKLVYMEGHNMDPDSDSDMQEQYDYINHKKED